MTDFLVKQSDFRDCRVVEGPPPQIGRGQALLRVETFGMTANNVTYAVFGEAMSYWDFFPTAEDGWGRLPTWGFAEVESSEADGVEPGTRLYGDRPSSSHLVVAPVDAVGSGFVDGSPHKAELPSAYHRYLASGADPFYREDTEEIQMLLRPLFFTSFLIDDQLDDEGLATRGPVIVSSASSKTSIAAAFLLAQREDVELVGLTGAANTEFVEGLGVYDRTVAYDAIDSLERGPAPYVDVSGDGDVWHGGPLPLRRRAHPQHGGGRHPLGGDGRRPGRPARTGAEVLLRPDQGRQAVRGLGRTGLESRVADAWHPFCEWIEGWLETIPGQGFDAVQDAWVDVLEGRVPPRRAHVLTLVYAGSGGEPAALLGADRRRREQAAEAAADVALIVPAGSSVASCRYSRETGSRGRSSRSPQQVEESATVVVASSSPARRIRSSAG